MIVDLAGSDLKPGRLEDAVALHFDICDVLNMLDIEGDITPGPFQAWGYKPSAYVSVPDVEIVAAEADLPLDDQTESWGVIWLCYGLTHGQIRQDDLIYAGNVLQRYTALLEANGQSL